MADKPAKVVQLHAGSERAVGGSKVSLELDSTDEHIFHDFFNGGSSLTFNDVDA